MYFNIVQPLVCKAVTRLHLVSFWPAELFLVKILIPLEACGAYGSNFVYLQGVTENMIHFLE